MIYTYISCVDHMLSYIYVRGKTRCHANVMGNSKRSESDLKFVSSQGYPFTETCPQTYYITSIALDFTSRAIVTRRSCNNLYVSRIVCYL